MPTPLTLGDPRYLQGYLDNPLNWELKTPKSRNGTDYRKDEYRGYEAWQFQCAPLYDAQTDHLWVWP